MDEQPEGMTQSPQGGAEVIIVSFLKVVYTLKYQSNACLFRQWLARLGVLPV